MSGGHIKLKNLQIRRYGDDEICEKLYTFYQVIRPHNKKMVLHQNPRISWNDRRAFMKECQENHILRQQLIDSYYRSRKDYLFF